MNTCTKPKILFILHLPMPVHGAAMVGQAIKDSERINREFECRYVNLSIASSLEDIGRFRLRKILKTGRLYLKVLQLLDSFHPNMVYITPNASGLAFIKEYLLVKLVRAKGFDIVAHFHNKGVYSKQHKLFYNLLYKSFFKNLKVILLSKRLIYDIEHYINGKRIYICPNGIPERLSFNNENVPRKDVPELLFFSNMMISKGVLVLLDSLVILIEKGVTFRCVFAGGETSEIDSSRFQHEVMQRGLSDYVSYKGRLIGAEKEAIFDQADIFIFPTMYKYECFPLVLLEAMQHSLPCITTDEGGIPDIVEDGNTGFLVKKGDAKDLAEKIMLLLNNPEKRRNMGSEGYKKYYSKFTMEKFEDNFISIMKECCIH